MTSDRVVPFRRKPPLPASPAPSEPCQADPELAATVALAVRLQRDLRESGQDDLAELVDQVFLESYAAGVREGLRSGGVGA